MIAFWQKTTNLAVTSLAGSQVYPGKRCVCVSSGSMLAVVGLDVGFEAAWRLYSSPEPNDFLYCTEEYFSTTVIYQAEVYQTCRQHYHGRHTQGGNTCRPASMLTVKTVHVPGFHSTSMFVFVSTFLRDFPNIAGKNIGLQCHVFRPLLVPGFHVYVVHRCRPFYMSTHDKLFCLDLYLYSRKKTSLAWHET